MISYLSNSYKSKTKETIEKIINDAYSKFNLMW
jgi:hypothetical protein